MTQEELDAMEISFKYHGFTWNQTNFAVAVIRNHVEPLRQQLDAANTLINKYREETTSVCQQLQEVCNAIGSTEYMDPPDGGSVTIAEQVSRMREDRDQLRQQAALLRGVMNCIAFSRTGQCVNLAQELFDRETWAAEALAATEPRSTK